MENGTKKVLGQICPAAGYSAACRTAPIDSRHNSHALEEQYTAYDEPSIVRKKRQMSITYCVLEP
jgi:hypothetical protein